MPKEDANSPPRPHPPIGIDLGTTYSAIAYLDETGRPTTLANSLGDLLTLSAVLVDRHEIVVGREAAKASAVEPQSHAECFKRNIGTAVYRRDVRGAQVPPEVLSEVGQAVPDELCVDESNSVAVGWLWQSLRRHGYFQRVQILPGRVGPGLRGLSPSHRSVTD